MLLLAISILTSAKAENSNLVGAWQGPKDMMFNICALPEDRLGICYCGIFRTFGWVNVALTIDGDSLIIKAKDYGSPMVGRFHIESVERLTGTLTMGNPGEDWYFSGPTEFIKQKPIMPDNLNQDLEGIILPSDYGKLALDRDKAWDALSAVSPDSYGYSEKRVVEKLLNAKTYPITPKDLMSFRCVRSIQIDAIDGIFSYPYFNCRFKTVDGKVFFEKTTGSQRKSGYVYQNNSKSLIFLGGWSVNNDPQTKYGSSNSVAGTVYKISPRKAMMIFPTEDNRVEIYELTN